MDKNETFYPNDKVKLVGENFETFKKVMGVTEWVVNHIKTPTRKNGKTLVVCLPIKNGKKGVTLYQFTKESLTKVC